MKFTVNTDAKTAKKIVVDASEDFVEFEGYLDYEPDGIDDNVELLDVDIVEGNSPFISKLYKMPANDIWEDGFTVIFTYGFNSSGDDSLYFPADFQHSIDIKNFDDVRSDPMQWYAEAEVTSVAYGGVYIDYSRFLAEDYGYFDDDDDDEDDDK